MPLTARQSRFLNEYLVDMNATNAAVRAGYSVRTAKSQASRLLTNVNLQKAIKKKQTAVERKLEIDREAVIRVLVFAIEQAREQGDPVSMISACAELNKMMGYHK
mgnify:CR=1 FL=1